jgi:hypothetical protein
MTQKPLIKKKSQLVLSFLALILVSSIPVLPAEVILPEKKHDTILIVGPLDFQEAVEKALDLLSERDPEGYAKVKQYVQKIYQGKHSRIHFVKHSGQFELHPKTAFASSPWLASAFVHEACHSAEHRRWKGGLLVNKRSEVDCNQAQAETLEKIGGTAAQIDHLKKADGTHFDVDRDGRYTFADRENQDW